jgi:GT2 family glycosyltransferase
LVFLDGDCVPERDFVAQHRRLQEPSCFVNGSRVLLSPELSQSVMDGTISVVGRGAFFWLQQRLAGRASKLMGVVRIPDGNFRKQNGFLWKGIRSCNMGVWRRDFEAINGFDESFVGWGHEDADFVLRLHNLGLVRKNGFCATEVYHLWHKESSRDMENVNAKKVRARMGSGAIAPTFGYRDGPGNSEVVVQTLG